MDQSVTLAERLGRIPRPSALIQKAASLGLNAERLEALALDRGCDYYDVAFTGPRAQVSEEQFSNAELAVVLLHPALRYAPHTIRLGAAILSAEGNTPREIAGLAKEEGCEDVVRYVAEAGEKFEPTNDFWEQLLALLPASTISVSGVLPHPTRFVAMTGFTRRGVEIVVEWIRPRATVS